MTDSLESSLAKIRPHTTSGLAHQKAPATLLRALESTFTEQNTQRTSTAYFAALLTTLDGTLQTSRAAGPTFGDGDVLPAELYLLSLVTPFVPPPVIRSNLGTIINLTAPLFAALVPHAPPLRSQLALYDALFRALERAQLDTPGLRQTFESILHLCLDPRPKVRKRAAELVKDVLSSPPPPLLRHPYADRVAAWVKASLSEAATGLVKFKGKKADHDGSETGLHLLAFLRPILPILPSSSLPAITSSLLSLPRLGNPYLSQSAYSILASLLAIPVEDPVNNIRDQLPDIITAVLSSPPSKADTILISSWGSVLANALVALHSADPNASSSRLGESWQTLWALLESSDPTTRKLIVQSLDLMATCFTPSLVDLAIKEKTKSTLGKIISRTSKALESIGFASAVPDVLATVSSLILRLRFRSGGRDSPTAAEGLLLPLIKQVAELRVQRNFEHKEAADSAISAAMGVMGPHVILRELPLNLDKEDRDAGREPRAFLLPMLSQPHPSPLGHFVSYFVPLTERMFDLQQTAEAEGRQSEAKLWNVLVHQIWTGLSGYCWGSPDLKEALTPEFSQLLSQLLYTQPELRIDVLRALTVMVTSNAAIASGDSEQLEKLPKGVKADMVSQDVATSNLAFLRSQTESWLAVFFNVYSTAGGDGQGTISEVISSWVSIADEKEIAGAYKKLVKLLKQNLKARPAGTGKEAESITAMTLDLLALVLPHLSPADMNALFNLCLSADVLESKDNAVQKRGYKILAKAAGSGKATVTVEETIQRLEKLTEGLAPAAKKDRFLLLNSLVNLIPPTSLHVIPTIVTEAVLGTKEPSEKARNAAFDLIVTMGRKMSEGGVVRRDLVDGMDDESSEQATASLEEYMTMIAGGLAGATPHMISATVTAISRLVFEFKDAIPPQMHTEIFATLLVFLSSANREIVKSALGYIKLAIHTMPVELLRPHLPQLVPALLHWSHDHKNHFKAKVRHIFERMIRRFGYEDVYACAAEEEARKVLSNIKKRKERAKRKKGRNEEEDGDAEQPKKPTAGDAFEDVLYGSESELGDSDDDDEVPRRAAPKKQKAAGARLRVDDDEPMDLLSGAASRITQAKGNKQRKPGKEASQFKTDEDSGKMIIDESEGEGGEAGDDVAGEAYREAITSADGFTRGPNGRIKFNKDTKKRRLENMESEDVEMADADGGSAKKAKRRPDAKFGHEFKAKKAGGDIKKGGLDPYAYLPLSQAAKRKGRKERLGVAGKK